MKLLPGMLLLLVLGGCLQSGGSGTLIPGEGDSPLPPTGAPDFAPLADNEGTPLPEGVECGSHVDVPVDFGVIGYSTPEAFLDITENEFVTACRDERVKEPEQVCEACGWPCAVESPYFYRFSRFDDEAGPAILTVHIWGMQCGGLGLEYRLPGQGAGEGVKVDAVLEATPTP